MQITAVPKSRGHARSLGGADGIDFVRCRICGKHLRVISGGHISTHGTDRETYIEEYRLSPACESALRAINSDTIKTDTGVLQSLNHRSSKFTIV